MNYPYLIPGMQADPASFVANTTLTLGSYSKPLDARTLVTVDYSGVIPAISAISGFSFRVKPGGEPQLWVSEGQTGTAPSLSFFVQGGIAGRVYEVTITTKLDTGDTRSDVLNINVLDDDGCGCTFVMPLPIPGVGDVTSGDGAVIVNTAPRFFVSGTIPVGANVLDRWYNTSNGLFYDYVSTGITTLWQQAGGGGGGGGGGGANILNISPIHPDGVTTTFNLTTTAGAPVVIAGSSSLFVSVDGVWQDGMTQYVAVNNQVQFTQAPSADSQVFMLWFAPASST
jgi:hypothetical protein